MSDRAPHFSNNPSFAGSEAPVVYLNGMVLFVAGLAIVQAYNRWVWKWWLMVTLTGWLLLLGGLFRMIAPTAPQLSQSLATYGLLAVLVTLACTLDARSAQAVVTEALDRLLSEKPELALLARHAGKRRKS